MNLHEKYVHMGQDFLRQIENKGDNELDDVFSHFTYESLAALHYLSGIVDQTGTMYRKIYNKVMDYAITNVKRKQGKYKVFFLAISAAEWPCEELYRQLSQNDLFDVSVLLVHLIDRPIEDSLKTLKQNEIYFEENNIKYFSTYNCIENRDLSWNALGGYPDIIIHLTPWYESMPESFRIVNFPLSIVNFYIPYSFATCNSADGRYSKNISYNKAFHNMMYRCYTDSKSNLEGFKCHELLGGENVRYSGFPKMDYFFQQHTYDESAIRNIWKIPDHGDVKKYKKVVIAPHHAFLGYAGINFSTFARNAFFLLYLAQIYQDEISFIFKPHPNLRFRSVEAKVFKSFDEYDKYLEMWNSLPNAKVVGEGSYIEIFDTSDGMIMDSISFIAEYLYTKKPLLFLRKEEQVFNKLGESLMNAHYCVSGEDYIGIENYLQQVVLGDEDALKEERNRILDLELNYILDNKKTACEYIHDDIIGILG